MKLEIVKLRGQWWILGDLSGPIGPYSIRGEAESDCQGLVRFYRYWEDPGFVTVKGTADAMSAKESAYP